MQELIKCPNCDGTGEIILPESKSPNKSYLEDNPGIFSRIFGKQEKPKLNYKICSKCNGLGMIRR
ncbi:MAG: hypothetical protein JW967_09240 [Dehalococcoidales bacterium]|nr:hypothetical protein [Dehalococcoidales bacterium]